MSPEAKKIRAKILELAKEASDRLASCRYLASGVACLTPAEKNLLDTATTKARDLSEAVKAL